ncbi:hypothetical protein ES689_10660 [Frigoribacterium sp. ACAM 257]|uniref:hypothetical protein n=1 Tax=Frigoribacterium sp. ACAM 257 TaxID=2508998 RepID=UPI0011BA3C19|nr:hypothetical protein [Frigoribacterium sp. ACAM 257]TWX37135.1 hypothetical protein ES689_10660 [Frigoribacterium sp. ACAM 257]
MISEQGAILIATVYPIGLLLLLVEGVEAFEAFIHLFGQRLRSLGFFVSVAEITAVTMSIAFCVYSVSSGTALDGFQAVVVSVSGGLLMFLFALAAGSLLGRGGISIDRLRSSKKSDDE